MQRHYLLITAVALIVVGVAGLSSTTWFGGPAAFSGGMYQMMMGGGMMGRDGMREMRQEMMSGRLPPGVTPEDLPEPESAGADVLVRYCGQCHHLPNPAMHTDEDWPRVEDRMVARERMMSGMHGMGGAMMWGMRTIQAPSAEEEKVLLAYLQRHALKAASLEALGAPGTPGLALFRSTCSQCHALPDPALHTSDEWPGVVERMRKNMETMGKPVITDRERDEIVGYLKPKAR